MSNGITDGGTRIQPFAFYSYATGVEYDSTTPAVISGAVMQTNSTGVRTASLQNTKGSDGLSNSGTDAAAYTEARVWLHGWDGGASTWSRVKHGATAGLIMSRSLPAERWKYASPSGGTIENSTTPVTIIAGSGSLTAAITDYVIEWATLGGVTELLWKDDTAGTTLWRQRLDTAAGRVVMPALATPIQAAAGNGITLSAGTAVTGKIYANMLGHQR